VIHHAGATAEAVGPLAITMIESAFDAGLVPAPCWLHDFPSRLGSTLVPAVHLAEIAARAEMEELPAPGALALSKRLVVDHRSTPAELLARWRLPCELASSACVNPTPRARGG